MTNLTTRAAVMSTFNDEILTTSYGHGELVTLPLHYYDDDRVSVFVERFEGGVRVSDRGMTAMRLHMAGLNVDSARVEDAWRRSLVAIRHQDIASEEGVISAFGDASDLGRIVLDVAEASLRIDQLRWSAAEPRRGRFSDRVVRRVTDLVGDRATVTPNAAFRLSSGRTRQITAAVGDAERSRLYLQAVSGSDRAAREKSVEHCHFLFSLGEAEHDRKLAVISGSDDLWDAAIMRELDTVGQVAFFSDEAKLRGLLAAALTGV